MSDDKTARPSLAAPTQDMLCAGAVELQKARAGNLYGGGRLNDAESVRNIYQAMQRVAPSPLATSIPDTAVIAPRSLLRQAGYAAKKYHAGLSRELFDLADSKGPQ